MKSLEELVATVGVSPREVRQIAKEAILLQKKRTATLYANMLERKRDDMVRSAVFRRSAHPDFVEFS